MRFKPASVAAATRMNLGAGQEQRPRPPLRGRPVIVGDRSGDSTRQSCAKKDLPEAGFVKAGKQPRCGQRGSHVGPLQTQGDGGTAVRFIRLLKGRRPSRMLAKTCEAPVPVRSGDMTPFLKFSTDESLTRAYIYAHVLGTAASTADPVAAAVTSFLADLGNHDDAIVGEPALCIRCRPEPLSAWAQAKKPERQCASQCHKWWVREGGGAVEPGRYHAGWARSAMARGACGVQDTSAPCCPTGTKEAAAAR